MSAFALRKQMLEKKEAAARAAQAVAKETVAAAKVQSDAVTDTPAVQQDVHDAEVLSRAQTKKESEGSGRLTPAPSVAAPEQKPPITPPKLQAKSNASVRLAPMPRQVLPVMRSSFQPNKQNFHQKADGQMLLKLTDGELFTSEDEPLVTRDLTAPPEWNKLISELASPNKRGAKTGQPVLFVCGPKSSGKSTFSRLLTNRLLTKETSNAKKWHVPSVAVLDIDPGQPEFATPGSLSLVQVREPSLSPPFCRPYVPGNDADGNKLIRSHELASVSPATDPDHYIESVQDLFSLYRRDLRNSVPLIVNTPGWIQGTGLEILIDLINKMRPSQVIYMSQDGPEDTVAGLKSAYPGVPFIELPSQPGDLKPPAELLADAMNGTVVSIVAIEDLKAFRAERKLVDDTEANMNLDAEMDGTAAGSDVAMTAPLHLPPYVRSPEGIPLFLNPDDRKLDPRYSRKLGVALVRGIDTKNKELHLLTPLPADAALDEVMRQDCVGVVLVCGKFDLPTWAYTEDLYLQGASKDSKDTVDVVMDDGADNDSDEDEPAAGDDSGATGRAAYAPALSSGAVPPADGGLSTSDVPWVETLQGNQKRDAGSRVWRVRRDLGRNTGGSGGSGD
ncbi:MAG: Polynucleotide 5'-hydroxyl-kinase grc3 [Sporothrix thermara]